VTKENEEDSRWFSGEWHCTRVLDVTPILNFWPPSTRSHDYYPSSCHLYVAFRVLVPLRASFLPSKIAAGGLVVEFESFPVLFPEMFPTLSSQGFIPTDTLTLDRPESPRPRPTHAAHRILLIQFVVCIRSIRFLFSLCVNFG